MNRDLMNRVLERDELAALDAAERRLALRALALEAGVEDVAAVVEELADEIDGFGPLSSLMREPGVTDVMVNGPREVWVERNGELELTDVGFGDERTLRGFIDVLAGRSGARVDASQPMASARLRDGSRLHVVLPPVAPGGPLVSIRRFPQRRFDLAGLVARGMLDERQARMLRAWVNERRNIAISGATGSGKTTLLDALVAETPGAERVIVVEETSELSPGCRHAVSLVTRDPNVEGKGEVRLDELARAALRMRPDRIVVGEVRGPEMATALDAMSTGHEGSMLTVHARDAAGALARMASLACRGARWLDRSAALEEVRDCLDVVVHLVRRGGCRQIAEILEL